MGRLIFSGVLVSTLLIGGCASAPYGVGAAPGDAGLARYELGRPILISRAEKSVVQIAPVAGEFDDRIVLSVIAVNHGAQPVNFGYENIGAVYEDGGAAKLVPPETLRRETRGVFRKPAAAVSVATASIDAADVVDPYRRQPEALTPASAQTVLRTTTIDPSRMAGGVVVIEKPWLTDRVRVLDIHIDLGGESHGFRLAVARLGVAPPMGGSPASRADMPYAVRPAPSLSPYARPETPRGVIE